MTVLTTVAALQTLHRTIAGVASAPTAMPSNADQARLPVALVWPGEATWQLQAIDLKRQERTYVVRCYVQPVAQGIAGPDEGYQACVALLDDFGRAYLGDPTLGGAVDHITALRDSGVSGGGFELRWGEVPYWGFVYRVTVVEKSA
ncbi:MAG: hypothetical protein WC977_08660 [Anaerovoracaceae bacterium]